MLESLATLVDVSLVRAVTGEADARFDMLQTVREFGAERLEAEDDRMATQRRHACWFLELAEEAERHFRGPEIVQWLADARDRARQPSGRARLGARERRR